MKAMQLNVDEWLRREAHVTTGLPFRFEDYSCLPVAPQTKTNEGKDPIGFLVTHGAEITFVPAKTPDGEQIMTAWAKNLMPGAEAVEQDSALPAECWYG